MPAGFPRYPSRLQVIDYLEDYARTNELRILFATRAASVQKTFNWAIETTDGDMFESRSVIIATGLSNKPIRPSETGEYLLHCFPASQEAVGMTCERRRNYLVHGEENGVERRNVKASFGTVRRPGS
jgi:cation diffusion facilitator CzcD-associated flavoprotein CzcO